MAVGGFVGFGVDVAVLCGGTLVGAGVAVSTLGGSGCAGSLVGVDVGGSVVGSGVLAGVAWVGSVVGSPVFVVAVVAVASRVCSGVIGPLVRSGVGVSVMVGEGTGVVTAMSVALV